MKQKKLLFRMQRNQLWKKSAQSLIRERKGKKEQDLSAYQVTETIHYALNGEDGFCPECGTAMKEVTTEITKTLKFIPAIFERKHCNTFACSRYNECKICK